jgi:prepilin-type N-terminal cleavage/methylation domain-containing protein
MKPRVQLPPPCHNSPRTSAPRGFTLIELLVIVAIFGLLALFVFPAFQAARETAANNLARSNLQIVLTGIHNYQDAEEGVPINWLQLRDGGYIDDSFLVADDGSSAVKDGYRFTLTGEAIAALSGTKSPIVCECKPLSPAISSVDHAIADSGEVKSIADAEKVKARQKIVAEVEQEAVKAIVKVLADFGQTDVAGAVNSVGEEDQQLAKVIITSGSGKFGKQDLAALAGTDVEPKNELEKFARMLQEKAAIGSGGKADDVEVEVGEDVKLKEDWFRTLFSWDYYIDLVEQIEARGPRTALMRTGAAAAAAEDDANHAPRLYDAIEKQVGALERSGMIETALAAALRRFLSVRRL